MKYDLFEGLEEPADEQATDSEGDEEQARSLLDGLLEESRLYKTTQDYQELLDFTIKLRNFAPFNAMLLNIQKPGLTYAASAMDWKLRFNRQPRRDARPLLILWPFGPVALVYDVQDTDGDDLPEDAQMFPVRGQIDEKRMKDFAGMLAKKGIEWASFDGGDASAGSIEAKSNPGSDPKAKRYYLMRINRNHSPVVQFVTLAHELGHLFLGHLGKDRALKIPDRFGVPHTPQEIEAESVAYIVCHRQNITPKSQTYLSQYVKDGAGADHELSGMDFYQVMRAAGQVETLLGLGNHVHFTRPS
ncbi:MAG: ImmA/IrrE family metallo-endopeptidase [Candidatus Thiodiazotropha taylori]|nr:ImmA/IrrE family metallo-endopeptidase [Candidatus Thiodiazotropha taylori]MCG8096762.1 ImmA/IrrE family metallo-endopeptidase [Candidatus Thiodiazotropha endolucinida]MCG8105556.1 ImmA/IrrE family metallo-endopeptidase [Candidatus Thiodiazotropha taylori]MCG8111209.1 ImmA/IrrE family metallo-endopeptidase [Candidatus Thiodiazotropha taylori]MCW4277892.1 ImmA/IrrE family metallo-endopeptidase [Candidatus Thiodiazotropha taylori]